MRSSVPGVRAGTRGAKEGELGPRLQQQRQGSEAVSCATIGTRNCGAILPTASCFLSQLPPPSPLPAAASARPLPAPLGGAGAGRGWLRGPAPLCPAGGDATCLAFFREGGCHCPVGLAPPRPLRPGGAPPLAYAARQKGVPPRAYLGQGAWVLHRSYSESSTKKDVVVLKMRCT